MTSLKWPLGFTKGNQYSHRLCGPDVLAPLYLSHKTKPDGEVTIEEHVERSKDGFFRFRAANNLTLNVNRIKEIGDNTSPKYIYFVVWQQKR